jgi:hypothetical protein
MTTPGLFLLLLPLTPCQDVTQKISTYRFASNAPLRPAAYVAELAGAKLELNIAEISGKPGVYLVSRSFYRPGQTLLRKSYINIQRGANGDWEGRGGLKLRIPQDAKLGPVVQESSSGVEAIPSTMWIQYSPK